MTEEEWLECSDPAPMLEAIRGRITDRQTWLFVGSCFRRTIPIIHRVTNEEGAAQNLRAVEVIERFVDGVATEEDVRLLCPPDVLGYAYVSAICAGFNSAETVKGAALNVKRFSNRTRERREAAREAFGAAAFARERGVQSQVLRCIVGNRPLTPALAPSWLTREVITVAEATYEERILPVGELDPVRLAVLSDALEEAGCTDAEILTHLRSPGPHVRGCWALDLLLGKS